MRRRRSSKSFSWVAAALLELGTLVGIIALAQPTWTKGLIENVAGKVAPQASQMQVSQMDVRSTNTDSNSDASAIAPYLASRWQPATDWNDSPAQVAQIDRQGLGWTSQAAPGYPILPPALNGRY